MANGGTISGVFVPNSQVPNDPVHTAGWIANVLSAWAQSVNEYADRSKGQPWINKRKANRKKGDAVYWYSERVDVAFFAATVTKLGFMTLLELPHIRRRRKMAALTETRRHRVDLTTFDERNDMSIWEFKRRTLQVGADMDASEIAKLMIQLLKDAKKVVRNRSKSKRIYRWAGAFVPIQVVRSTSDLSDEDLRKLASHLRKHIKATKVTAVAWVFPAATRSLYSEQKQKTKKRRIYYPGVFLALRNIGKPSLAAATT